MDDATTMRSSTAQQEGLAGAGFGFDQSIPPGGYRWWYVDGFSECGQFGATVIAFIGSVFSPYYFRARRNGAGVATEHVSLNVILYGQTKARWCMTERGSASLQQSSECLHIGPSAVRATNEGLLIDVAERATPLGQRVNGQIKLGFVAPLPDCFELDAAGEHWWWPIAPLASIDVQMDCPNLFWKGSGYFDSNYGTRPLETGFVSWNWCRGHVAGGGCQIHYDAQLAGGGEKCLSLAIEPNGSTKRLSSPDLGYLPRGPIWRVARPARLPPSSRRSVKTLEDTPFYTRSHIRSDQGDFMHESLDMNRFCQTWVQCLLPFRMPRMA